MFHRRPFMLTDVPFYAPRRSLACIIGVHLPMSGVLGVVIMLQVTGHAGSVPKATLERGRSVSFPFSGNHGYIRNLRRSLCHHGHGAFTLGLDSDLLIALC